MTCSAFLPASVWFLFVVSVCSSLVSSLSVFTAVFFRCVWFSSFPLFCLSARGVSSEEKRRSKQVSSSGPGVVFTWFVRVVFCLFLVRRILFHRILLRRILLRRILSCRILSCRILLRRILLRRILLRWFCVGFLLAHDSHPA